VVTTSNCRLVKCTQGKIMAIDSSGFTGPTRLSVRDSSGRLDHDSYALRVECSRVYMCANGNTLSLDERP
jgi:hypothetical protein